MDKRGIGNQRYAHTNSQKGRCVVRMAEFCKRHKGMTLLLIIGAVYFFLKFLTPLFSPILVAMLFVTMFGPLLKKMQEKLHIHRQVGAGILLTVACAVLAILVWTLLSWMLGSLPKWVGGLDSLEQQIGEMVAALCAGAQRAFGIDSEYLEEMLMGQLEGAVDYLQSKAFPQMLSQSLTYAGAFLSSGAFLITFFIAAVLLAKDYDRIMNELLDREECHMFLEVVCGIIRYLATFVRAQLIIMAALGTLCAIVLGLLGVRNGILWGILAGVLDALPFVGTGIVLVPLAIGGFIGGRIWQAVLCLVLFVICAILREFLEPRLIGSRVGIPPIAVLASVYAGVGIFGVWGILKGPLGFMIIYETRKSLDKRLPENPSVHQNHRADRR